LALEKNLNSKLKKIVKSDNMDPQEYTRFERTRIISARALQISMGAPILINTKLSDPKEIAKEEFEKGVLPITVRRVGPKKFE